MHSATTIPEPQSDDVDAPQSDSANALKLCTAARLPTLANHCFILGEAKRADVIWSEGDFLAICEHMLNENPANHFLSAWIDKKNGEPRFAKADFRLTARKRASWAFNTITGKAKARTSIGFYPSNGDNQSRWGAIDFDAHHGEHEQARRRALEAFSILLQQPQLHLILCASGNGYHLFIYTRDFFPVGQWIVLLKQVCEWVGAPLISGVCEIFPNERAESQPTGKGIRAPGTLNPKTGTLSLVEAQTVAGLLETLPRTWSSGIRKAKRGLPLEDSPLSQHRSTNNYFLTTYSGSTEAIVEACLARHPVQRERTRNEVLMALIGELAHKFGREAAERIVEEHYRRNQGNIRTAVEAHRHEFGNAWEGMRKKIVASFPPAEMELFNHLASEHQREGFLIIRAFAGAAKYNKEADFQVSQRAWRIG